MLICQPTEIIDLACCVQLLLTNSVLVQQVAIARPYMLGTAGLEQEATSIKLEAPL